MQPYVTRVLLLAGAALVACQPSSPPPAAPLTTATAPTEAPAPAPVPVPGTARPAWSELTPAQREALAPLRDLWPGLEADSKKKWLEESDKGVVSKCNFCEERVKDGKKPACVNACPTGALAWE